jgi:2-polyprenyl-6-methoxyphenol hydroxylase-like FAD-dependent oxidoreductase
LPTLNPNFGWVVGRFIVVADQGSTRRENVSRNTQGASTRMTVKRVLIVGGGPAGMTTAIGLSRQGIDVDLIEIERDWKPAGVGLLLQSPPLRALRMIGLLDPCIEAGFAHDQVHFCDAAGNVLFVVRPPLIPGEELPAVGIARPALHKILADALSDLDVNTRVGKTITGLEERGDVIAATFDDGHEDVYDLVVGADGVNSVVRSLVFPDARKPKRSGQHIWRASAPRPEQLRNYPIMIGPSGKLGLVPISEDEIYVYLLKNGELTTRPPAAHLQDLMRQEMVNYSELVDEIQSSISGVDVRNLSTILLPSPWHRGRVIVIGDAAHTTTPHLAFGVGMAIEDAIVLAELVAESLPLNEMLARFMARRYDRCRLVVETSLQLGEWEQHPVPDADPARLTREAFEVLAQPA